MAHIGDIVFDSRHPASLARFWAAALDGYSVAPYDEEELRRLRSLGINGPDDDPTVLVEAGSGQVRLFFQLVPEAKTVKNRVHLDLRCADRAAEVSRLVALGARQAASQPGPDFTVLHDPEGNELCLLDEP